VQQYGHIIGIFRRNRERRGKEGGVGKEGKGRGRKEV